MLLRPFQNTPFVDDWVYGWSVEHLLLTGELRILDNASSVNPVQVLWGALFCLPTGFSFTMLRVSTWVLSAACLCGLRLLMSEIGVGRAQALLATATLALYPVYFVLSHTFMTDVPFLCALVWFSYAAARALRTERLGWLAVAVLFAALAIGIRPAGIVAALALPLTIVPLNRWRRWSALVLMLLPFVAAGLVFWWYSSHIERRADLTWIDGSPAWRRWQFKYGLASIHVSAVNMWWFCTAALGLAVAPLAIARFSRTHVRGAVVVSMIGAGAFALGPLIGAHDLGACRIRRRRIRCLGTSRPGPPPLVRSDGRCGRCGAVLHGRRRRDIGAPSQCRSDAAALAARDAISADVGSMAV